MSSLVKEINMFIKDRRVVHWVTKSGNEWPRVTTSGTTSVNNWYNKWQRMTTSGTTNDKKWQWVIQRVITSDNKWQWVTKSDSSGTTNENGTVHFQEWMIAVLSMTKADTLLLQGMDGCN